MSEQRKTRMRNAVAALAVLGLAAHAGVAFAGDAVPSRGVQIAQLFGESDEEKAARQQHEDNQDAQIRQLTQRISDMEDSLRRLTGEAEDLGHRLDVANQRINQMQKDFDYKICTLSAQQLGASTDPGDPNALPCSGQSTYAPQPNASTGGNGPIHLIPPPPSSGGVLGTLPSGNAAPSASVNAVPPSDTRKKFDAAMSLLARAQYDEASASFRNFADTYPGDDLTPQAVYWVGDIAYVQKDYQGAAQAFVEEIKKYPTSPRAPDSMLKLGQSLIAMDQKKEGCSALAALASKYPAAKTEIEQAKAARKDSCH